MNKEAEHILELGGNINFPTKALHYAVFEYNMEMHETLFIIPTDAHYYKNHRMLKQFNIITLAPTCFGSHRNRHQGAVLCLAKNRTPAQRADMPP